MRDTTPIQYALVATIIGAWGYAIWKISTDPLLKPWA